MAYPGTRISLPHADGGNTLDVLFGGTIDHAAGLNTLIDDLGEVQDKLGLVGSDPTTAGDVLTVVTPGNTNYVAVASQLPLTLNGNFDHWQRVGAAVRTSTTTFSVDTSFAADRIFVLPAGASVTQQRGTNVPDGKSQFSNTITGAASVTTVDIGERIRSAIVTTRGGQSQVFSCYVYNGTGGAFTPNLRIGAASAVDNFGTINNRLDQALASCPDATWTRVSVVFDPSAYVGAVNGMECVLRIPSGSLNSGAKFVRIAQFDLRPGTFLRPYLPPDPSDELARCERYCVVEQPGTSGVFTNNGQASTTANVFHFTKFRRLMHATPSLVAGGAGADYAVADGVTVTACNGLPTISSATPNGARVNFPVAAGLAQFRPYYLLDNATGNAKLTFIAELT